MLELDFLAVVVILEDCFFDGYVQLAEEIAEDAIKISMCWLVKRCSKTPNH